MTILTRIEQIAENEGLTITALERKIGASKGVLSRAIAKGTDIQSKWIQFIVDNYPLYNSEWLLTGDGHMLKAKTNTSNTVSYPKAPSPLNSVEEPEEVEDKTVNLIPFYNEVVTVGGDSTTSDVTTPHGSPTRWINAGDWFPGATSAITHYGDSMEEYPSGTILVLKRVVDMDLIVPGCNYSVETSEYRVTKRLQNGDDDHFIAYSSNKETYPDGKQIHEPFMIPKRLIRHIDLVLGTVGKEF